MLRRHIVCILEISYFPVDNARRVMINDFSLPSISFCGLSCSSETRRVVYVFGYEYVCRLGSSLRKFHTSGTLRLLLGCMALSSMPASFFFCPFVSFALASSCALRTLSSFSFSFFPWILARLSLVLPPPPALVQLAKVNSRQQKPHLRELNINLAWRRNLVVKHRMVHCLETGLHVIISIKLHKRRTLRLRWIVLVRLVTN